MAISFLVWMFIFGGFLRNELRLIRDAIPYWTHFRFLISNLASGIYPLWDPWWNSGVPAEFFLRRIGNFNPLYLSILLLYKLGLSLKIAYLLFLSFYYFLGMAAFYLIANKIFKNSLAAFLAFLLLTFSSLSAQLFFSFIVFVFVPIFWFFYFLLAFSESQQKHFFIGMVFTLMIILTTYIPFYFLTMFLLFIICYSALYFRKFKNDIRNCLSFIQRNKKTVIACALILIISLGPGVMLYKSAEGGGITLPARHKDAPTENVFTIGARKVAGGDISSQIYFNQLISNLDDLKLGVLYIPIFAYLIFLLGLVTRTNKRIILLALFGSTIFLIALTDTTPVQKFLYKHIFYFKYIRQSYHFFWFAVLPAFILMISEQFRMLINFQPNSKREKMLILTYLTAVHVGFIIFLLFQENVIWSSFLVVILSLVFFLAYVASSLFKAKDVLLKVFICLIVIAQPIEAYHHLSEKADKSRVFHSQDTYILKYLEKRKSWRESSNSGQAVKLRKTDLYYSTPWYYFLFSNLDDQIFNEYVKNIFIVYARAETLNDDFKVVDRFNKGNTAFVAEDIPDEYLNSGTNNAATTQMITDNSPEFEVMDYTVNSIKLKTNYDTLKFLVYNDSYHKGWQASINGTKTKIYRANVAFKGLWLPAGENIVKMQFLSVWRYIWGYFYMLLFFSVFCWLIISLRQTKVKNAKQ